MQVVCLLSGYSLRRLGYFRHKRNVPFRAGMRALLVSTVGLGFASAVLGQVPYISGTTSTPGTNPAHEYIGSLGEVVDPATGLLSIKIMTPQTKERGPQYPRPAFVYQTPSSYPIPSTVVDSRGNINLFNISLGYGNGPGTGSQVASTGGLNSVSYHQETKTAQPLPGATYTVTCRFYTGYIYTDPTGGRHDLGLQYYATGNVANPNNNSDCSSLAVNYSNAGGDSQYKAFIDVNGIVTVMDSHGRKMLPAVEDANGNGANGTGRDYGVHIDTTGASIDNQGIDLVASPSTSSGYSYTGSVNVAPNYTINFVSTNGCSSYTAAPWSPSSATLHNTLSLPGNLQYAFGYDSTYGRVNKITYPNGATVSYEWNVVPLSQTITFRAGQNINGINNGGYCSYRYDTVAITKRIISFDGVNPALEQDFTYSTDWTNPPYGSFWSSKTTTVTTKDLARGDTTGSATIYKYLPMRARQLYTGVWSDVEPLLQEDTITYQSSTGQVLQTIKKIWQTPELLASECVTLPGGLTKGTFYSYAPYTGYNNSGYYASGPQWQDTDQITDLAEYDFGSADSTCQKPQSTPTRETVTAYHSFPSTPLFPTPSILDRPDSVKIFDHGQLIAETDYAYDENAVASVTPGALDHDESSFGAGSSSPRGNVTSVTKKCFQSCADSVEHFWYDETGQVIQARDANGNDTYYSYSDNYDGSAGSPSGNTNTLVTKITRPSTNGTSHIVQTTYGYLNGHPTKIVDENSQPTTFSYNDPWSRLREVDYPDGGQTKIDYADTGASPSQTTKTLLNAGGDTLTTTTVLDGMGHVVQTQLTSDPYGTTSVNTSVDGFGRVWKRSNPYRGSPAASTSYSYDALGRPVVQVQPDGSTLQWCYDGVASDGQTNCLTNLAGVNGSVVDYSDEAGSSWQRASDGLGHLINVTEDSKATKLTTAYTYDVLGNLKSVVQNGVSSEITRLRSFSYDSLSRLTSSTNPESGTTAYTYLKNGVPCAGDVSLPCSKTDSRSVTSSYTYDFLNRLISKTYSGEKELNGSASTHPTPATCYLYDTETNAGINTKGRLVAEWAQSGNCTQGAGVPSGAISWKDQLSYDEMGRLKTGIQCAFAPCSASSPIQYNYDYAGNVTYSANGLANSQTPQVGWTNSYDPAGRLSKVTSNWVDPTHPDVLFQADTAAATALSVPSTYSPFGGLAAALYGINTTTTNVAALSDARTYDNRARLMTKNVYGNLPSSPTAMGVHISLNPAATTFTATDLPQVKVHVDCNTNCGYVDYQVDNSEWGTVPLDSNGDFSVSLFDAPTAFRSVQSHVLTINYLGNATYAPGSSSITYTVVAPGSTVVGVHASIDPSTTTFTATNLPQAKVHVDCNTNCGYVDYQVDNSEWGTVPLDSNGDFSVSLSDAPTAFRSEQSHVLTINYLGNATYAPGSSSINYTVVPPGSTVVGVHASIDPTTTFTTANPSIASVHVDCNTNCGHVDFQVDNTEWGTAQLDSNGNFSVTIPSQFLSLNGHTLTIQYLGDVTYAPAASNPVPYTITSIGSTPIGVHASMSTEAFSQGTQPQVSVQVDCNASCGYVDYTVDGTEWGTVMLGSDGSFSAQLPNGPPFNSLGTHNLVIRYLGNSTYAPTSSAPVQYTVN